MRTFTVVRKWREDWASVERTEQVKADCYATSDQWVTFYRVAEGQILSSPTASFKSSDVHSVVEVLPE